MSSSIINLGQAIGKAGSYVDICPETLSTSKSSICDHQNTNICLTEIEGLIKKKTVTFKSILETSDDISVVNKTHNPRKNGPLISIMKKECPTSLYCSTRGDGIVRPSRLTEIIKNNENIDKTISLSFRTAPIRENIHFDDAKIKQNRKQTVRKCRSGSFFLGIDRNFSDLDLESSNENIEQLAPQSKKYLCRLLENWTLRKICSTSDNFSITESHSVCIICGTRANIKNLQNRKYGIIACDVCTKFISKLTTENVSSSTNAITSFKIQCQRKDGECFISSLPKNNIKRSGKIYDGRCSVCWLQKCVKAFQIPCGHKLRLTPKLFETLQNKIGAKYLNEQFDSLSPCPTKRYKKKIESFANTNSANNKISSINWGILRTSGELFNSFKSHENAISTANDVTQFSDNFTHARCLNSLVNKKSKTMALKSLQLQSSNTSVMKEYAKRQRMYFKGPRVKHVCRSASIALGQQIARFSNNCDNISKLLQSKSQTHHNSFPKSLIENICILNNCQQNCSQKVGKDELKVKQDVWKKNVSISTMETTRSLQTHPCLSDNANEIASLKVEKYMDSEEILKKNVEPTKLSKKHSKKNNLLMLDHCNGKEKSMDISIDFWNTFVSAEVYQTGFGLIITDPVSILALCFLCGSMDMDNLQFCASCCEPYHNYCVNEDNKSNYKILRDNNCSNKKEINCEFINKLNWVCPRCTVCFTCNMSSGAKLKCQKCKKHYHSTCMGTSKALLGADRPLICKSCLKCQSCFTTKVSKYVGNQPICIQCFQLRKSRSHCLVCNSFFCNISDPIILECSLCKQLVHSKCERLTEEQSNLLSNISTDIQFVCEKCAQTSERAKKLSNDWRAAVNEELSAKLLEILKLLSRCRHANVLKNRPETACTCSFEEINKIGNISPYKREKLFRGFSKTNDIIVKDLVRRTSNSKCCCPNGINKNLRVNGTLNILDIKTKIINGEYISLFDFNEDMNDVIKPLENDELILTYKEILCEKFSWFQNETKYCTDALEEDMFESCDHPFPMDDMISEDSKTKSISPEHMEKMLRKDKDNRVCALCFKEGDCENQEESRLLYYCNNIWVHVNCAIWSCDVYEEFDGSLQNVNSALYRGRSTKCAFCEWLGATITCLVKTCSDYYHFQCARKVKFIFKSNRSVYCSIHYNEKEDDKIIKNFSLIALRPLYIETDKYRTYVEPSKVEFMMGSLSVLQLGTVFSKFCDTSEAIVPVNFCCTRLYWSCREPWRLVKYNVRTFIQKRTKLVTNDMGKNFTVDHSENINIVEKSLLRIADWHAKISRECNGDVTRSHNVDQIGNRRFSKNIDIYGGLISDVCIDEEPQNNSDLLPPEIKDVIFDDLPHDILDGISMLDIFPKFMIYEDLIAIENKPDSLFVREASDKCVLKRLEHRPRLGSKPDLSSKFSYTAKQLEKTNTSTLNTFFPRHELKRSSSEVIFRNIDKNKNQRRCSGGTCNCFDDINYASSDVCQNELRCPNFSRRIVEHPYNDNKSNTREKNRIEDNEVFGKMRMEKIKLTQLDGTDDSYMGCLNTTVQNSTSKSPVKCDRCHCTYRTFYSFQRHLVNCEQISTSESETETISRSSDSSHLTVLPQTDPIKKNLQLCHNHMDKYELFSSPTSNIDESELLLSENVNSTKNYVFDSTVYEGAMDANNETSLNNAKKSNDNFRFNGCCEDTLQKVFGQCFHKFSKRLVKNKRVKCHNNSKNLSIREKNKQIKVNFKSKQKSSPVMERTVLAKEEHNVPEKQSYNPYFQNEQQFVVVDHNTVNNVPLYFQPVQNPSTLQQHFVPLVIANNEMQFTSIPSSANTLVQGSLMHTDMSGNLLLSGLQLLSLPSLQVAASMSSHPVAAFGQQQSLQLGSNQVFIGNSSSTELVPNANQMILSVPPMYYGLETIVQNTIMSSQQFVSTAMQGVLGENASFSATTTQVFQSSTIEPVNDGVNAYILLNNSDGPAVLMPQTNVFLNSTDIHNFHTTNYQNVCTTFPNTFIQDPEPSSGLSVLPNFPDRSSFHIQATLNAEGKMNIPAPEKLNIKNAPVSNHATNQNEIQNFQEKNYLFGSSKLCNPIVCKGPNTFGTENKLAVVNKINSNDSAYEEKKVTRKYVKKCKVSQTNQADAIIVKTKKWGQCSEAVSHNPVETSNIRIPHNTNQTDKEQPRLLWNTNRSLKNNHPQCSSALELTSCKKALNGSEQIETTLNTSKLLLNSPSLGSGLNNFSTNHLSPILQPKHCMNPLSRPTNRVLPMQSINKSIDELRSKNLPTSIDDANKRFETLERNTLPISQCVNKNEAETSDIDKKDSGMKNECAPSKTNYELIETTSGCKCGEKKLNPLLKLPTLDISADKSNADISPKFIQTCDQFISKRSANIKLPIKNLLWGEKGNDKGKKNTDGYVESKTEFPQQNPIDQQSHIDMSSWSYGNQLQNENASNTCEPLFMFEMQSEDGFYIKSKSIDQIWEKVFESVQVARRAHGLLSLPKGPFTDMCGVQMLGLKTKALKFLIEQLPGTDTCIKYTPKYYKHQFSSSNESFYQKGVELLENICGAVRCEPFEKRSNYDIFSWLASRHRKQPKRVFVHHSDNEFIPRRCTTNLPMAMKYRTLKETYKHNIGVFRSSIHGRGLFCTEDIEAGEMVIEYAGELIRSTLTDKRERCYDSRGIGCYMFKIDDKFVVDATMRGNAARFINHSCEPNCYSKVVDILGHKHIIIFSLRRIVQGEELTYDYKFPFEDVKIPCSCGSKKCRKYLN